MPIEEPSMWWPTPAEPTRWFDAADIVASRSGGGWRGGRSAESPAALPLRNQRFDVLAQLFGLTGVEFVVVPGDEINASSSGSTVSVNEATMRQPDPVCEWIVAHELAHIRSRHGKKLLWLIALFCLAAIGAAVWLNLLSGVVVATALFFGHRWVSRAFERQADITASRLVDRPDMRDLTEMALRSSGNLAPSVVRRMMGRHPAPAERLELLSRL